MNQGLVSVLIVTLVTWIGIFVYLVKVDRAISKVEKDEKSGKNKDDL